MLAGVGLSDAMFDIMAWIRSLKCLGNFDYGSLAAPENAGILFRVKSWLRGPSRVAIS